MKKIQSLTAIVALAAFVAAADDATELKSDATSAISAFKTADASLGTFFANSAGSAVFPNVGKGGLIVGGAHGKGVVYEKDKVIGQASLTQASIGAQAGGQTFAEIIFFETPQALADFKEGKFEMTADVSAVIAAEGAAKSAKYKHGVAVFAMPKKGAMVQASIGGQKFKFQPELQPTGRDK
jgi:lipid-binding SYLF domain-containing protein